MPNRLHPAKWGPRTKEFDPLIQNLIRERGFGAEREYFGIETEERAETVRRGLRNAGRHLETAVKAFWKPCPNPGRCQHGGPNCQFHVYFTAYDKQAAAAYKASQAEQTSRQ